MAETERASVARHDADEPAHFRAMKAHQRAAEIHAAMADLERRED